MKKKLIILTVVALVVIAIREAQRNTESLLDYGIEDR